jgi:tripartite-type tricarboxylate transporter receptor subunit TctC
MRRRDLFAAFGGVAVATALTLSAQAQDYPNRSIRLIVPFAAGGAVDTLARLIGAKVSEGLGQPVIVDNRPGAAGNLGTDAVAKSPPDGYTILQTTNGHAISPAIYNKLPYDAVKDFAAITQLVATNLVLVTNPNLPVKTLQELVALAKAKPGTLNYGSTGVGNPLHLTMEMLKKATGMDLVVIPYKGDAPLNTALIGGEIQLAVVPLSTSIPHVEAGTLRALAVTGPTRSAALPNVPTVAESGVPGFDSTSWQGWFAPAGTPATIIARLQSEVAKALAAPDVLERLKVFGSDPVGGTPEVFAAVVRSDVTKFERVVKEANIPKQD